MSSTPMATTVTRQPAAQRRRRTVQGDGRGMSRIIPHAKGPRIRRTSEPRYTKWVKLRVTRLGALR